MTMMPKKDAYWFKHDSNASSDLKLRALRRKYSWEGVGWYWFLIEQLRNQDSYLLPYNELSFDGLSSDMDCTPEETKQFIDECIQFKLLTKGNDHFYSERLNRDMAHLDDVREKTRAAGKASAEKRYGKLIPLPEPLKGTPYIKDIAEFVDSASEELNGIEIPEKRILGEFKNVLLSDVEQAKLVDKFGMEGFLKRLENLSAGIASKGYKYKDFYATILNWNRKDEKEVLRGTHKANPRQLKDRHEYTPEDA